MSWTSAEHGEANVKWRFDWDRKCMEASVFFFYAIKRCGQKKEQHAAKPAIPLVCISSVVNWEKGALFGSQGV